MASFLKSLDLFPKTLEDVRIRTYAGAIVSVVSAIVIIILFISELSLYLNTGVETKLFVDTSRGQKLRINIDITFPRLPCAYLSLDALDISGEAQLDVAHNVFKRRLHQNGSPLAVEKGDLNKPKHGDKPKLEVPNNSNNCATCYGAESTAIPCCETCESVREAYRQKGWAFNNAQTIAQCQNEGWSEMLEAQKDEGCQVYGYLMVQKVAGNFHIAPGKSFQSHHNHVHDLQPFKQNKFDLSHTITKLSFGYDFPGVVNPLDGVAKKSDPGVSAMYQYFVKIVPTVYEESPNTLINTNQFSATEYYRKLGEGTSHGLPGVFFMYDLSPIKVKFEQKENSFAAFLTGICAIIGGVYTISSILDSFIYNSVRTIQKKMELGKAS